jgi:hypothetical protein
MTQRDARRITGDRLAEISTALFGLCGRYVRECT